MNLSERRLRAYVRYILREGLEDSSREAFQFLHGVTGPLRDFVKRVEEARLEKRIQYMAAYDLTMNDIGDIIRDDVNPILDEIDTFKPYGAIDNHIKRAIGYLFHEDVKTSGGNWHSRVRTINSYAPHVTKAGGDWDALLQRFVRELEDKLDRIKSKFIAGTRALEEKLDAAVASHSAARADILKIAAPLKRKYESAVDAAMPALLDPQALRLVRQIGFYLDQLPQFQGIAGGKEFTQIARAIGPNIGSESWNESYVRARLLDHYHNNTEKFDDPVKMRSEADRLTKMIEAVPDFIAAAKKKVVSRVPEAEEEASYNSPLGQIAFATSRKRKPAELNTDVEEELLLMLIDHFGDNKKLPPDAVNRIKEFMSNGWYESVFKEAASITLYRGIAVDESWMERRFGKPTRGSFPMKGSKDVEYVYGKSGETSSWTDDRSVSFEFASTTAESKAKQYAVVMHARLEDNPGLFLDASGLYDVAELAGYESENEHFGLGPIKVFKIEWKKSKLRYS